jgi:hypothetical protein
LDTSPTPEKTESLGLRRLWKWLLLLVPVLGVTELVTHWTQTRTTMDDEAWAAVRVHVRERIQPADLLVFAPSWVGPVGRMQLGDELVTLERGAYADVSRFARAFEVSTRGQRHEALRDWPQVEQTQVGALRVRLLSNPAYREVLDDLVAHDTADGMQVELVLGGRAQPCDRKRLGPATGALGFGPAVPAERFVCPQGAHVATTVMPVLDYSPRRCLHAPPPGADGVLRLRFHDVQFGTRLVGHHALYVEAERDRQGAPVRIEFSVDGRVLGSADHEDGDGWTCFELNTSQLAGQRGELVAEVSSRSGHRRVYCFEATTR